MYRVSTTPVPVVARVRRKPRSSERQVSNTFARIYLRAARGKLARGDLRGAWIDVKLGLGLEQAPPLLALLDEIRSHPGALSLTSDAGRGGPGWGARR